MGHRPKPEQHDTFDEFVEMERKRLQEHAQGELARALGMLCQVSPNRS